jgi:hypothetical protein
LIAHHAIGSEALRFLEDFDGGFNTSTEGIVGAAAVETELTKTIFETRDVSASGTEMEKNWHNPVQFLPWTTKKSTAF